MNAIKLYEFGRNTVNEPLSTLDDTDEDYFCADLYILPPDSTLFDDDDEVEPEGLNHLTGKQVTASTEVVMHTVEPATSSSLENESSSTTKKSNKESCK